MAEAFAEGAGLVVKISSSQNSNRSLFITGTDTGVGKSIITAGLAAYLQKQNINCGVMKPVESGMALGDLQSDTVYLKRISGVEDSLNLINTYTLKEPLAPGVAAKREGVAIELEYIKQAYLKLLELHQVLLVEGAGGLLVPLSEQHTMADLIVELKTPVLLVGRLGLGTLNHTLLSLEYLQQRNIPVAGVVLNTTERKLDLSAQLNPQTLSEWTKVPLWGVVEFIESIQNKNEVMEKVAEGIGRAAENYFNLV